VCRLYLGGYFALSHAEELGITAVLSVVNGEMSRNMCEDLLGRAPIHVRLCSACLGSPAGMAPVCPAPVGRVSLAWLHEAVSAGVAAAS